MRERGELNKKEKQIIKPVIHKLKKEERKKRLLRLKHQRQKLGYKLRKPAKGPNPLSRKKKSTNSSNVGNTNNNNNNQ